MKKWLLAAAPLLGLGAGWAWLSSPASALAQLEPPGQGKEGIVSRDEGSLAPSKQLASTRQVERLEAELARKDLELAHLKSAASLEEHVRWAKEEARENEAHLLDERLFVEVDQAKARSLTEAVEASIASQIPPGLATDVLCGSTMCRITLGASQQKLGAPVESLIDSLGKTFGGSTVQSTDEGETLIYLAEQASELAVATAPKPTTADPANGASGDPPAAGDVPAAAEGERVYYVDKAPGEADNGPSLRTVEAEPKK